MKTLMDLQNIHKHFGKTQVLKGVDLTIQEGEIVSVLGPSGCGKSTLLKIIAGILPLDDGTVTLDGTVVSSPKETLPTEKRNINMVFQNFALWPHMKVRDNILFGLKIKKTQKAEMEKRLAEVVNLLHLDGLVDRYPGELSGGQQQRISIARALITKPKIVLLDEPLCNLDIQLRIEMRTEMAYLFRKLGTTVFHVTHDPSEAFAMADKIVVMNNGVIEQMATPMDCYQNPKTQMVAGLLGASNKIHGAVLTGDSTASVGGCPVNLRPFLTGSKDPLTIRFRPEACAWADRQTENAIPVSVVVSTFEGNCYRIKVKTTTGDEFCILRQSPLAQDALGFVTLDQEQVYGYDC